MKRMHAPTLLICLMILLSQALTAQIESPFDKGAQAIGQGNAFVGSSGHYSLLYNQAGIAELEDFSISVDAGQLYNNSGIFHLHAAAVIPTKKSGVFGLKIQRFGLEGYNFQNYALTYARPLFRNFKIAATFNMYQFRIDNYGNSFIPNLEIGVLSKFSDRLSFGAHVANPLPLEITENTNFPTVFTVGLIYKVSPLVGINLDVEKNIEAKENVKLGIYYEIHPKFHLRLGFNSFPGSFHFGFSLKLQKLDIHMGNALHPILGNSTGLGIVYSL